jgi:hypothetical protein
VAICASRSWASAVRAASKSPAIAGLAAIIAAITAPPKVEIRMVSLSPLLAGMGLAEHA